MRSNDLNPTYRLHEVEKLNEGEKQFAKMEARNAASMIVERHKGKSPEFFWMVADALKEMADAAVKAREARS